MKLSFPFFFFGGFLRKSHPHRRMNMYCVEVILILILVCVRTTTACYRCFDFTKTSKNMGNNVISISKYRISPPLNYPLITNSVKFQRIDVSKLKTGTISSNLKATMIHVIMFYKNNLSPILPPNCRFQPSCSSYGLDAIETYGPWKGGILTVWRLLRCNPFGGSGYDPPIWPPPNYLAGSKSSK